MSVATKKCKLVCCDGCGRDTASPNKLCYRCTNIGHSVSDRIGRQEEILLEGVEVFDIELAALQHQMSVLRYCGSAIRDDL